MYIALRACTLCNAVQSKAGKACLIRQKDAAVMVDCKNAEKEGGRAKLRLQYTSAADITAMSSPEVRLITVSTILSHKYNGIVNLQ